MSWRNNVLDIQIEVVALALFSYAMSTWFLLQYIELTASLNSVVQIQINPIMRTSNVLGPSTISDKGIRVSANKNIVLYGINKKQFSTDAFLALPTNVIGKSGGGPQFGSSPAWSVIQCTAPRNLYEQINDRLTQFDHCLNKTSLMDSSITSMVSIYTGDTYYAFCNHPINTGDDRCQFAAVPVRDGTVLSVQLRSGVTVNFAGGPSFTGPVRNRSLVCKNYISTFFYE